MKTDDYLQGFRDGMSVDKQWPMAFQFMGYKMEELMDIVNEHDMRKFWSGSQWENKELKMDQEKINAQQKREEFRAKLAGFNISTKDFNSIIDTYDLVHCPELMEKPAFEIRNASKGIDIKVWADGRIEGITGTLINRIPQLIAEAKGKAKGSE